MNINKDLYTAIVTPMLNNGEIDYDSFERILRYQADADCGILILGSTGEALALSFEEQCEVVKFTCSLELDTPIMVGVGGSRLEQQVEWIEFCNTQNIDCFLLVTPLYAKPGTVGQTNWFLRLLDAAQRPCVFYNVPSRTGVNLSYEALKNIKDHKNAWAIKEASGDCEHFRKYAETAPNLRMYSGEDGMLPELSNYGAIGLISVISNIWPRQVKSYVKESVSKTIQKDYCQTWKHATKACFEVANPIPVKVWLEYDGVIKTNTLRAPLVADELTDITNLKKANSLVKQSYTDL
ncbi:MULTISPECIES: 4-hydroxy-tetrahydrodipicolinate synthase [unclassified Francisella]|uniref:4-hydroxy-tetrahydrodipicolinate synthase n=1 Tax=unclassified Francisella TaxID=2610885 RepID=UPI002E366A2E|nr:MULTISPECIES: 4-hydroxy-tetrahydrodipicolinate synthase [unclassified Francisella]MED7819889.1 4-hydroxy-tetrahydrodipicolinate synthase [Francisella sp. 19S2-4]MED7830693.1 4-hydroxy-tetrahydrodipicolinate synthase [Francisella sp. 19S2-10]